MDLIEINWFAPDNKNIYEGSFMQYDSIAQILLKSNDETLMSNINIEEYIDYCILEIYIGNFD